jgi:N-acetylmuramoyl-L-alanine amidase
MLTIKHEYTNNFNVGLINVRLIIMHWTVCKTQQAVNWFKNPTSKASAHYIIDHDGSIIQMVDESDIAWHAGTSSLKDYPTFGLWHSLNPCAIGIELEGRPSDIGLTEWDARQLASAIDLCHDIHLRHPAVKITDHSSVCPEKIDVKKGTGIDVFPWDNFVYLTGIEEA